MKKSIYLSTLVLVSLSVIPMTASSKASLSYDGHREEEPLSVQEVVYIPPPAPRRWLEKKVIAEIDEEAKEEGSSSRDPAESH